MQKPNWLRAPKGVHWTPRLAATIMLVAITGALLLSGFFGVLRAVLTFGGDADPTATLQNSLQKHEQLAKVDRDRFDGRSAFFMPPAPVRNIPKPPPPKIEKPPPPPAPVIPTEYGGKKPIAILGPIVYFDNFQIKVGEQSNGIKVIATNAPWSVKLGHEGGEYDVPLWEKTKDSFLNGKWSTAHTPGIESASAPNIGKDKSTSGIGARMGTPGTPNRGASDPASPAHGAMVPGSTPTLPPGVTPIHPLPGRPGALPGSGNNSAGPGFSGGAGPNSAGPAGAGLPQGAPLPNEPIRPPAPSSDPTPNSAPEPTPAPASPNASSNNGWNSNQMAPPPPFTSEQIKSMTLALAKATQSTLEKAKSNPNVNGETAERLANELAQISQRINELNGQSPPS